MTRERCTLHTGMHGAPVRGAYAKEGRRREMHRLLERARARARGAARAMGLA